MLANILLFVQLLMQESSTLQNTEKLEELKDQATLQQRKTVTKWKSVVETTKKDKILTKDCSDAPPKLAKTKKTNISSQSVANKWRSKIGGARTQSQIQRQPPSTASAKWASACSKTLAVNKLSSGTKPSVGAGMPSKPESASPSRPRSATPNKPSVQQSNSAPSSTLSKSTTPANKDSVLQSKSNSMKSTATKPGVSGSKANWQKATLKTKSVSNFSKPMGSSASGMGAKKPYVPYKPPAKQEAGAKPGFGGSRKGSASSVKFGGGKMGGRLF